MTFTRCFPSSSPFDFSEVGWILKKVIDQDVRWRTKAHQTHVADSRCRFGSQSGHFSYQCAAIHSISSTFPVQSRTAQHERNFFPQETPGMRFTFATDIKLVAEDTKSRRSLHNAEAFVTNHSLKI